MPQRPDGSLYTDFSHFEYMQHDETKHPAYSYFKKAMTDKDYGNAALQTAWVWFKRGWNAHQ